MPAFLNFRGLGYTESLTDWRNSYFGKSTNMPIHPRFRNCVDTALELQREEHEWQRVKEKDMTTAQTKKVTDLVAGDRVLMDDGLTRVVKNVGKGFVKYRDEATGKLKPSIMIDWKDGSFSQMPSDDIATLAPVIRRGETA